MSTQSMKKDGRRRFLKLCGAACLASGFAGNRAWAQAEKLGEDDPTAVALGYKHDAGAVDANQYPAKKPDQNCQNCALFANASDPEAKWAPCAIFSNKLVAAEGWCSAWAKKAG